MAPPGLLGSQTAPKREGGLVLESAKGDPDEVNGDSQKPVPQKDILFSRFPTEIQQGIWAEALQKPACHSFRFVKSDYTGPGREWEVHLQALQPHYDPSAYRYWKSLLHCKTKNNDEDKLQNISFQAGFRNAMVSFQPIKLKVKEDYYQAAAIDAATDLVIINFARGPRTPAYAWFEHSTDGMNLDKIRRRMTHFKRVAIHYKAADSKSYKPGPFRCYCPTPFQCGCYKYKACCFELACFLDCFPNLEEFYFVVEEPKGRWARWADGYKKTVRAKRYRLAKPEYMGGGTFELSHFFDTKREYIQHCPPGFLESLGENLAESPIIRPGGPRECLVKAKNIYCGVSGDEAFKNKEVMRRRVKFGLLIGYAREKQ